MIKTTILTISIFIAFVIIGMQSMKPASETPIVYTEDEKAFIKKCSEHRYVSECKASIIALRELK